MYRACDGNPFRVGASYEFLRTDRVVKVLKMSSTACPLGEDCSYSLCHEYGEGYYDLYLLIRVVEGETDRRKVGDEWVFHIRDTGDDYIINSFRKQVYGGDRSLDWVDKFLL